VAQESSDEVEDKDNDPAQDHGAEDDDDNIDHHLVLEQKMMVMAL